jgi:hypothetical protein
MQSARAMASGSLQKMTRIGELRVGETASRDRIFYFLRSRRSAHFEHVASMRKSERRLIRTLASVSSQRAYVAMRQR